jgi:cysteinyl-tRNA synthetase
MPLSFFNTLSRKTEPFVPLKAPQVGLYTCGPTVYHFAHIGNLRCYLFEDQLRRVLTEAGYQVEHVCNITDVGHLASDADEGEDKMEKGAAREGKSVWEVAAFYTQAFMQDTQRLRILSPTRWCKATDHIPEQVAMVQALIDKGFGYPAEDGIYYDTSKFPRYGDLARKDLKGQEAGARVAVAGGKRNNEDFALWKFSPKDSKRQMEWDAPFGKGFPGWHIECSAMSVKYLGAQFDLHCGGVDHIPVHHTNEIAQTEAVTGVHPWVKVWMHSEFLILDKGKMSKSSGEFLTLQALIDKGYEPLDYRFFCMQAHYRAQLGFSFEALDAAKAGRAGLMSRIAELLPAQSVPASEAKALPAWQKFWAALEDDLNSPRALAALFDMLKDASLSPSQKKGLLEAMEPCLGLGLLDPPKPASTPEATPEEQSLLDARAKARAEKQWSESDRLRDALKERGILVKDGKEGQSWQRIAAN